MNMNPIESFGSNSADNSEKYQQYLIIVTAMIVFSLCFVFLGKIHPNKK